MKNRLGLIALAVALAWAIPACAGVPVAVAARADSVPTLAPLLKKVTPGVVSLAINWNDVAEDEEFSPLHKEFRKFFNIPWRGPFGATHTPMRDILVARSLHSVANVRD